MARATALASAVGVETEPARPVFETLVEEHPDSLEDHLRLLKVYVDLGAAYQGQGRFDEAQAILEKGLRFDEEARRRFPRAPAVRLALGDLHINLARLQLHSQHTAEAEASFQAALAVYRDLLRESPDEPQYRYIHARTQNGLMAASPIHLRAMTLSPVF